MAQQLSESGHLDRVFFLGYQQDVLPFFAAADLFVFPSHSEGLPRALLEAMACSLPVIAADSSSIPEIIYDQRNGLLFTKGDHIDLGSKVCWALAHPYEMIIMAGDAVKTVAFLMKKECLRN